MAFYFEQEKDKLFTDPWAARNDYIQLVLDPDVLPKRPFWKRPLAAASDLERGEGLDPTGKSSVTPC